MSSNRTRQDLTTRQQVLTKAMTEKDGALLGGSQIKTKKPCAFVVVFCRKTCFTSIWVVFENKKKIDLRDLSNNENRNLARARLQD